jgi:ATP synthase protein I
MIMSLKQRAEALKKRLSQAEHQNAPQEGDAPQSSLGVVFRLSVELVSALLVGLLLGLWLDHTFKTKPLFLIVFVILGIIAGFFNIFRSLKGLGLVVNENSDIKDKNSSNSSSKKRRS